MNVGTITQGSTMFAPEELEPASNKDREEALRSKLWARYVYEKNKQSDNRSEMQTDRDYYDGYQIDAQTRKALQERGQPEIIYNKIKPMINWLTGTEKRTRTDWKILPREEADVEAAELKTKLMKFLSDVNRVPFARSRAFEDAVIVGVGWLEDGVSNDPENEIIYSQYENWRNIYYDSNSTQEDLSDARYLFRTRWLDSDVVTSMFGKDAATLSWEAKRNGAYSSHVGDDSDYLDEAIVTHGIGHDETNGRYRVQVIECWYREPKTRKMCRGGDYSGLEYDAKNVAMKAAYDAGECSVVSNTSMVMHCAVMTANVMLWSGKSPYRHNKFPFTPIWCYRDGRSNAPHGVVRSVRSNQDAINKRASKALLILNTKRVITEVGAVPENDYENLRNEAARPDGVIVTNPGRVVRIETDNTEIMGQLTMLDRDARAIQDVSGVTDENMGRTTNATSGKAILARQEQGSVVTASLFDKYHLAVQMQGEKQLSLIEQFMSEPKVLRVLGEKDGQEWVKINQQDPVTGEVINDITARQADFVVSEQDFRASQRQAMFENMGDMIAKMPPEVAMNLLDLWIDISDVPNKAEFVARIRKMNGQQDASHEATPEEQQQMQQAQAQQQQVAQVQEATARATVAKLEAEVAKLHADAAVSEARAIQTRTTAMYEGLQAAQIVATVPHVAPVADRIMAGAGHRDMGGQDPQLPDVAMQPQPIQQPMQQAMPPSAGTGAQAGIETIQNDGVQP